ncbi:MAG: hypothetical protein AAF513_08070 [Pseudomonadota bacterium]
MEGANTLLEQAIDNNISWYRLISRCHRRNFQETADAWFCATPMPPYYSNYHVRRRSNAHIDRIARLVKRTTLSRFSVADAYAELDAEQMRSLGFRSLFHAQWFGGTTSAADPATAFRFRRVSNSSGLHAWEERWRLWSPTDFPRLFLPPLLEVAGLDFYDVLDQHNPVGGFVSFAADGVNALSNAFVSRLAADAEIVGQMLAFITNAPGNHAATVGYGSTAQVAGLAAWGQNPLGAHRVWLRG